MMVMVGRLPVPDADADVSGPRPACHTELGLYRPCDGNVC